MGCVYFSHCFFQENLLTFWHPRGIHKSASTSYSTISGLLRQTIIQACSLKHCVPSILVQICSPRFTLFRALRPTFDWTAVPAFPAGKRHMHLFKKRATGKPHGLLYGYAFQNEWQLCVSRKRSAIHLREQVRFLHPQPAHRLRASVN